LRGIVREAVSIMMPQARAKGLQLHLDVQRDVPDALRGDPHRIRQCVLNLLGNAIKFTQVGRVDAVLTVTGEREGCLLIRFDVRDTGIGIAPAILPTLYEPFTQSHSSTPRHFGGTGLGLSIVRRLVELMGGEVGVESEVGKGSTFWFVLPMKAVAEPSASGKRRRRALPAASGGFSGRVLLVEDNTVNQKVA